MNFAARVARFERAVDAQHAQEPFSGVIDLRIEGEPLFSRAFGMANLPESIPNTPRTRFGMASGSKTFTSTAICQLVEQGKARFDSHLLDCIDIPLPNFDPDITLQHLLTHTSGIPDYFDEEESDDYEAVWREHPTYDIRCVQDFLPLFTHLPMKFKPGKRFSYSNSGFILLGLVVEHISGMTFTDFVEKNVLEPAGMIDSGYFSLDQLPDRVASGYIPDDAGGWRSNIYSVPIIGAPDGGAFTTADDLARFWDSLVDGRLFEAKTLNEMLTPRARTNPGSARTRYGFGVWMRMKAGAPEVFYMLGEDPGVAFYAGYSPGMKLTFTLMGNTTRSAFQMLETLLPLVDGI